MKESREFFNTEGEPEALEARQDREEYWQIKKVERAQKSPELEHFLKSVDFGLLEEIFRKHAERSGVNPKTIQVIRPGRIYSSKGSFDLGSYTAEQHIMDLPVNNIRAFYQNHPEIDLNTALLASLIHEETHVVSKTECQGLERLLARRYPNTTKSLRPLNLELHKRKSA